MTGQRVLSKAAPCRGAGPRSRRPLPHRVEGKVSIVGTNCVPRGRRGLTLGAEIPVLTLHTPCGIRPLSPLPWFSKDQEPEPRPALRMQKKDRVQLVIRGKGREACIGAWLQDHCSFPPLTSSSRPAPPLRCPLPAVSGAFLWQQLL